MHSFMQLEVSWDSNRFYSSPNKTTTKFAMKFVLAFFVLYALVDLSVAGAFAPLKGKFVDISAKGEEVWAIDRYRKIFRFDFAKSEWAQIASNPNDGLTNGQPNTIGASPDGWTWITTTTNKIYRYNPTSKTWAYMGGPFDWLFQVSAISKDLAVGQGGQDKVWITTFPHPQAISHIRTRWSACGEEDDECWVIERDTKKVWRTTLNDKSGRNNAWIQMPGASSERDLGTSWAKGVAETVDVQSRTRGVMTTTSGQVYMWNGDEWTKVPVENAASKATIGRKHVFVLDQVENVLMAEM